MGCPPLRGSSTLEIKKLLQATNRHLNFFLLQKFLISCKAINDPSSGKHQLSLPFHPATPSSPSRTLEGLFELTQRNTRALDSPRSLLPELQRNKDTVREAPG